MKQEAPPNKQLREARLSRLWQYVEDKSKNFAIISASRSEYSQEENDERFLSLKNKVRNLGFGFIELRGGYVETSESGESVEVTENSILIPKIPLEGAIELGSEYEQESILYKNSESMAYVLTSGDNVGKIDMEFMFGAGKNNFSVDDPMNVYFSSLRKGPHKGKKISFKALYERDYSCDVQRQGLAGGRANPVYKKVFDHGDLSESATRSPSRFNSLFTDSKQAFAVISATREYVKTGDTIRMVGNKEKLRRTNQLAAKLSALGKSVRSIGFNMSFVPVFGGYKDIKSEDPSTLERSYVVAISQQNKKDDRLNEMEKFLFDAMIELGIEFQQESVLIKDSEGMRYVGTCDEEFDIEFDGKRYSREKNVGEVLVKFSADKYEISEKDVFEYFTRLKNRDISFVVAPEAEPSGDLAESFMNRNKINWQTVYPVGENSLMESQYKNLFRSITKFDFTFELDHEFEDARPGEPAYMTFDADVRCYYTPGERQTFYNPGCNEELEVTGVNEILNFEAFDEDRKKLDIKYDELPEEDRKKIEELALDKLADGRDLIKEIEEKRDEDYDGEY